MGVVESAMRKNMRIGQNVDVTLIGGRELRGTITAFGEDGIMLAEGGQERPVAFLGIATFIAMQAGEGAAEARPAAREPEEPAETTAPAEGWIDRYEPDAGLGSIISDGQRALFESKDVLDQRVMDLLDGWIGRAIAVQFTLHTRADRRTATSITLRSAQEKYRPAEREKAGRDDALPVGGQRYGFGEIVHFDKQNGYGKACEGSVKFLFRRKDISSAALWQEILRSENTCGIKIAFTVRREEKGLRYTQIREIAALQEPDKVQKPDFDRETAPGAEGDVNPLASVVFADGTVLEDEVRAGAVMFYNTDKSFGRLQQENGERYYFRAGDVMQKSLLDFLSQRPAPDVADTPVTFSVKRLPTGKLAAGRVRWNAPRGHREGERKEAAVQKEPQQEGGGAREAEEKPAPAAQLNAYCAEYLRAWGGSPDMLLDRLAQEAARCQDAQLEREILLQRVALSDVRREKRDDAMRMYLRACAQEDGGQDLNGFLAAAAYSAKEMFDALTRLFAVSDGACSRLCGIIAADGGLVALRGEILERFGTVPETAQGLRDCWRPLVEQERAQTDCSRLPATQEALEAACAGPAPEGWARVLEFKQALDRGETVDAAQTEELLGGVREEILRRPSRLAVEWMLPIVRGVQERLRGGEEAPVTARALCAVDVDGVRYACVELTGRSEDVCVRLGGECARVGSLDGCAQAALPCGEESAEVEISGEQGGAAWKRCARLRFEAVKAGPRVRDVLEREGVAVVCGAGAVEAEPAGDEVAADLGIVRGAQDAARAMLAALSAALEGRYGREVAALLPFPAPEQALDLGPEQARQALAEVLRGFADVCLLHDRLKGAHILCRMQAEGNADEVYGLAQEMKAYGVRTVLAAERPPEQAAGDAVLWRGSAGLAQALRAAGFTADRLCLAEPQEMKKDQEEKQHEIG